jgi:hypothetical protein
MDQEPLSPGEIAKLLGHSGQMSNGGPKLIDGSIDLKELLDKTWGLREWEIPWKLLDPMQTTHRFQGFLKLC